MVALNTDEFGAKVVALLPQLCVASVHENGQRKPVHGHAAFAAKLAEAKAMDKPDIQRLQLLHAFAFLGTDEEKKQLEVVSEDMYKVLKTRASRGVEGTPKKKTRKNTAEASSSTGAMTEFDSLFR